MIRTVWTILLNWAPAPKASPLRVPVVTDQQAARITSVAHTYQPQSVSNKTIANVERLDNPLREAAHWKTATIRSAEIP